MWRAINATTVLESIPPERKRRAAHPKSSATALTHRVESATRQEVFSLTIRTVESQNPSIADDHFSTGKGQ